MQKAIIIGSGIAGLASALRLTKMGYDCIVLEQNEYPGGKIREFSKDGFRFDMGPSLFTMPWLVDELFGLFGETTADYFQYKKLDLSCRYFFSDDTIVNAYQDSDKLVEEFKNKLGEKEKSIKAYLDDANEIYKLTSESFIFNSLHNAWDIQKKYIFPAIRKLNVLKPWQTMFKANKGYFKNPKSQQIFNRLATYNGSSPYKAPATLNVIAHLEHNQGAFFPSQGMASIVSSLYELARLHEIKFLFNQKVSEIIHQHNQVIGVKTKNTILPADIVVSNADIYKSYQLIKDLKMPKSLTEAQLSSSALVFLWGIDKSYPQLDLHNILFADNYKAEFNYLDQEPDIYGDPTVYIYISSKVVKSDAPYGSENWFVMVNAPTDSGQNWDEVTDKARKDIQSKINKTLRTNIEDHILIEKIIHPKEIEQATSSEAGALYGMSSNSMQAAFKRHPNFSNDIDGLYFAGGSVHPGGGIPLCLASAKIVEKLITKTQ